MLSSQKQIFFYVLFLFVSINAYGQSISTLTGTGATVPYLNDIPAEEATLNNPTALITGPYGNVFFVDQGNAAIRRVDIVTGLIEEYYTILLGYPVGGVVGNNSDTLYFTINAGGNNLLWWYNTVTQANGSIGVLTYPSAGLCISNDSIFITSQSDHIVSLYVLSTGVETVYAGVSGSSGYADNTTRQTALFDSPTDILVGKDGNLYVCDKENNRIRKIDRTTDLVTTFAGDGNAGFNGNNILSTSASLNKPEGLGISPDGVIYIADTENNMVRKVDPIDGVIELVAGNGNAGFVDQTEGSMAELNRPLKVTIHLDGTVYFSDNGNERIRKVEYCTAAELPNILTSTSEYSICPDETVVLYVDPLSELNDQSTWAWYNGGCDQDFVSIGDSVTVNINNLGDYYVRGEKSCFLPSECADINISEEDCTEEVYFNSFSPNDDGINDLWIVPPVAELNTISFFNRWGDLIQEIPDYENAVNAWDGRNSIDVKVSPGTYFYVIEDSNENTIKTGWVQVIR